MKKLILFSLILTTSIAQAQDIYKKIAKETCKCFKKNEVVTLDDGELCFEQVMMARMSDIMETEGKTIDEIDGEDVGFKIIGNMMKDCDYMKEMDLLNGSEHYDPSVPPPNMTLQESCSTFHNGDYYYLMPQSLEEDALMDTTFATFSGENYLERMYGGKTYSWLEVEWIEDCTFVLKFKESNDPMKKNMSDVGDVYEYEIVGTSDTTMVLKFEGYGDPQYITYFRH